MLGPNEFAKYHALGNDYVVVDDLGVGPLTPDFIQRLCDRHRGIGSDGILQRVDSNRADFGLRIYNPDGSAAEKSGNGLRIFARCMYDLKYTQNTTFHIETPGGVVQARLSLRAAQVDTIAVHMGRATFSSDAIPMTGPTREVVNEKLSLVEEDLIITAVSVGNPHCVCFVDDLEEARLRRIGPQIERHPSFPQRTNVQFARLRSRQRIDVLIWERGAGFTLASGSSSCAVAAAALKTGRAEPHVEVHMPGGLLHIKIDDAYAIEMIGPATPVFRGTWLNLA